MPLSITPEDRLIYTLDLEINLFEFNPRYPKNPKTFGELLRKKRMDKRLTMKDIATRLGVSETTVYNWEIRGVKPQRNTYQKLLKFIALKP